MKLETTYSWIFLSVAMSSQVEPAKFRDISMLADGINHAVPSHQELQTSLGWLQIRDLVVKQKNKYSLTPKGKELHSRASSGSRYVHEIWKFIENEFAGMDSATGAKSIKGLVS